MPYYGSLPGQYQQFMPFSSLIGGLMAGQQFQRGSLQDQYTREQMEQARTGRQALQEYGQTRDVDALMTKAPEIGMQVQKFISGLDESKQKRLMNDINIFDAQKGMFVDRPESYAETYKQIDPAFAKALPTPEQFTQMTPDQRKGMLYRNEIIAAEMKGQLTQAQALRLQQQAQKLKFEELKTGSILTLNDAKTKLALAKTTEAAQGGGSKNLPQDYNLYMKLGGDKDDPAAFFEFSKKYNSIKTKDDAAKWLSKEATTLLSRNASYQEATEEEQKKMHERKTQQLLDSYQKLSQKVKGGGKEPAPIKKPLSQMTDDEIRALIAEKQAAGGR